MRFYTKPSPNFNERKDDAKIDLVIIHYTGMASTEAALTRLTDPKSEVSCHYLIDEEGNIFQLVDDDKRAWHAGVSSWRGKGDVNSRSIGIELSNRGHEPFTDKQLGALALLSHDLSHRHNIPPENFIGHSDIAPDRKQDPGPLFPWRKMASHDIGVWPQPTLKDKFNAKASAKDERKLKVLFRIAGYGVDTPSVKELVTAFQSRYEPHVFKNPAKVGIATPSTVAKLRALIRMRKP